MIEAMNKLTRDDLYSLEKYAQGRPEFRKRVLAHKKNRQVPVVFVANSGNSAADPARHMMSVWPDGQQFVVRQANGSGVTGGAVGAAGAPLAPGNFTPTQSAATTGSASPPTNSLTVILGWPDRLTTALMGGLVILYTVLGGVKAVTWTEVQQMLIVFAGLLAALVTAVWLLPPEIRFLDALALAGVAGRLNAITTGFSLRDRYTLWSGLIGGMFHQLSYFGTDQSQVQRYLTGRSIAQSRLSLLFNGVAIWCE